jgi:hypothetical protein
LLLHLSALAGHGGVERGSTPVTFCSNGGDMGDLELIHHGGITASAIFCRQGDVNSTSDAEAHRTSRWSSTAPCHQVIHSRWHRDGQRLPFLAEREPSSKSLLFLGGDA